MMKHISLLLTICIVSLILSLSTTFITTVHGENSYRADYNKKALNSYTQRLTTRDARNKTYQQLLIANDKLFTLPNQQSPAQKQAKHDERENPIFGLDNQRPFHQKLQTRSHIAKLRNAKHHVKSIMAAHPSTQQLVQKKLHKVIKNVLGADYYHKLSKEYNKISGTANMNSRETIIQLYLNQTNQNKKNMSLDIKHPLTPILPKTPKTLSHTIKLRDETFSDFLETPLRPYTSVVLVSAENRYQKQCGACALMHKIWKEFESNVIWSHQFPLSQNNHTQQTSNQDEQLLLHFDALVSGTDQNYPVILFQIDADLAPSFFEKYRLNTAPLVFTIPPSSGLLDPNHNITTFITSPKHKFSPPPTLTLQLFIDYLTPLLTPSQRSILKLDISETGTDNHIKILLNEITDQQMKIFVALYYTLVIAVCFACLYHQTLIKLTSFYLKGILTLAAMLIVAYFLSGPAKEMGLSNARPTPNLTFKQRYNAAVTAFLSLFDLSKIVLTDGRSASLQEVYAIILSIFVTALCIIILIELSTSYHYKIRPQYQTGMACVIKTLLTFKTNDNDDHMYNITQNAYEEYRASSNELTNNSQLQHIQEKQGNTPNVLISIVRYFIINIIVLVVGYVLYCTVTGHNLGFEVKYNWFTKNMNFHYEAVYDLYYRYIYTYLYHYGIISYYHHYKIPSLIQYGRGKAYELLKKYLVAK